MNIGLVNELAVMCDREEINIWEVIEAAATVWIHGFLARAWVGRPRWTDAALRRGKNSQYHLRKK
jgi:hypothetical protein